MKVMVILYLIILINFSYSQTKLFISPELQYERLSKINDFWINSPIILNDRIIFFYKGNAENVVLAGDFNGWKVSLKMNRISSNLFEYSYTSRLKKGIYRYKYQIDKIWTYDPNNTNYLIDSAGQKVSYFKLDNDFIPVETSPLWLSNDVYRFKYYDREAKKVSIVGNFNNWNPYSDYLKAGIDGEFYIDISLRPGLYSYAFVVDGVWVPDPNNFRQFIDETGAYVNAFYVEDRRKNKPPQKK